MNHEKMREHVHTGIDRQCASLTSDPYRVQRVLNMAHQPQETGGFLVMRSKKSLVVLIALICIALRVLSV